jgi:Ca2+-binding RTX toxin-like protein
MRRLVIMGALVALLVGVFASVAYARTFTCTDLPCTGTNNPDVINERPAAGTPDEIFGLRGADVIDASISFNDEDILWGGRGNDTLYTDDGDDLDEAHGGAGAHDTCVIDAGDVAFSCENLTVIP